MNRSLLSRTFFLLAVAGGAFPLAIPHRASAERHEACLWVSEDGRTHQVATLSQVPARFQSIARCGTLRAAPAQGSLAAPQDVSIKGAVRKEQFASALGPVALRWPRSVELLFGRTPQRAVADAMNTVAKVLRSSGFAASAGSMNVNWQIVFMDEELPESQIPAYLVTNCHPAWMTPPANLYVVGQRVVAGCGGGKAKGGAVADGDLAQILLHEIGHAVEYHLLQGQGEVDRMRAEGFACWFEQYAAGSSSIVTGDKVTRFYREAARRSMAASPGSFSFQGSLEDYARASLYFHAIVDRRGVAGLMQLYSQLPTSTSGFVPTMMQFMGWDIPRLEKELTRVSVGG